MDSLLKALPQVEHPFAERYESLLRDNNLNITVVVVVFCETGCSLARLRACRQSNGLRMARKELRLGRIDVRYVTCKTNKQTLIQTFFESSDSSHPVCLLLSSSASFQVDKTQS